MLQLLFEDVERIYCGQAMAALRRDGSVITWGHSTFGGDSRSVQAGSDWKVQAHERDQRTRRGGLQAATVRAQSRSGSGTIAVFGEELAREQEDCVKVCDLLTVVSCILVSWTGLQQQLKGYVVISDDRINYRGKLRVLERLISDRCLNTGRVYHIDDSWEVLTEETQKDAEFAIHQAQSQVASVEDKANQVIRDMSTQHMYRAELTRAQDIANQVQLHAQTQLHEADGIGRIAT
ncbi:unnamed protein product [Durusdinium trenchii]|uniref:Uncharacterized protein n=1 Tax=Durusdinium trenchii TaxID=1381693 RepID=A0ABP0JH84_9DINO